MRIAIIDDDRLICDSLNIILGNEPDIDVVGIGGDGNDAVRLAAAERPDILLLDIQMPGLNGIQAMKEIQKYNSNIVFIVISAYDKFSYAKEAINLGVLEYLTKPVNKPDRSLRGQLNVFCDRSPLSEHLAHIFVNRITQLLTLVRKFASIIRKNCENKNIVRW